jgi:Concanavalin A-like lectin/glucanases superfamily
MERSHPVYLTSAESGWRAVVQKEVDTYFLTSGSDTGVLRPTGSVTFGGLIDSIKAPTAIPVNARTHLALTYDGATLRLYVNGSQVASRTGGVGAIYSMPRSAGSKCTRGSSLTRPSCASVSSQGFPSRCKCWPVVLYPP